MLPTLKPPVGSFTYCLNASPLQPSVTARAESHLGCERTHRSLLSDSLLPEYLLLMSMNSSRTASQSSPRGKLGRHL